MRGPTPSRSSPSRDGCPRAWSAPTTPGGLFVVRVPARPAPVLVVGSQTPRAPGYFAAAVGTPAGPSLSPVWVERAGLRGQTAWNGPVWVLPPNGSSLSGTPLYSIDGVFVAWSPAASTGGCSSPPRWRSASRAELATGRSLTGTDAGFDVVDLRHARASRGGRPRRRRARRLGQSRRAFERPAPDRRSRHRRRCRIPCASPRISTARWPGASPARERPFPSCATVRTRQSQSSCARRRDWRPEPPSGAARRGAAPGLGLTLREVRAARHRRKRRPTWRGGGSSRAGRSHHLGARTHRADLVGDCARLREPPLGRRSAVPRRAERTGVNRRAAPGTAERVVAVLKP